ncbi:hypothetical protein OSB04_013222 [Centaurea solstitialis]|uniref:Disease resistance RPP13-like protein 1 n=1 Tax=Centaurea solstitialis TaxID=347529 RepID=A0AA38TXK3_9ASTR|nr:hypothetical protein OSB04_013222 [Centaurea solstitialis]
MFFCKEFPGLWPILIPWQCNRPLKHAVLRLNPVATRGIAGIEPGLRAMPSPGEVSVANQATLFASSVKLSDIPYIEFKTKKRELIDQFAMAEIILGAFMDVLFEKLASGDLMKLARSEGIETQLKKWKKSLSQMEAVLGDAEQKQIKDREVELWLQDLQDLAYDIDDVLDDLATEAMRRSFDQESFATTSTNKVFKFIPTCCTNFTPHNIKYDYKMSGNLDKITTRLHDLFEQKNGLGLNGEVVKRPNKPYKGLEETSLVDESEVMGREGDKEALLHTLLEKEACNQNVSIVSIVGLGGIGKTTLARVLYNEEKVKDHFELRAWVCVSEEFDVFNISKAIFQAIAGRNQEFANLDLLHVALKEKLSNKRFLVVLDDVWNEEASEWELLKRPFAGGAPGSKIIVTTRKERVAHVMKSSQPYDLHVLSEEKALSLFAQNALGVQDFDKHPSLKVHAEGIVRKCGGLPLALVTVGRVLWMKTEDAKWKEVLNSEIWDLPDENQILPALRLSYDDLPSHLKQLFAYCSLFPKDYFFEEKKIVLLWMAQGFLNQKKGNKSKESLGLQYFEELKSRSFFQASTSDYGQSEYIMHDLINDLATSVAGGFFFRLDNEMDKNNKEVSFERFRHVSFIGEEYGTYGKFKELRGAVGLRTFLPLPLSPWTNFPLSDNVLAELLPQLRFVRVLSLSHHSITEIPQSIDTLKHVRYLNFSETNIERLREKVGDLYNLQSLLLYGCCELSSLPGTIVKLKNLRHLDINDTPSLKKMPLGIGGLRDLQTLPKVIIEGSNGFKISELKDLSYLRGQLSILGLDKVIDPTQAKDANLIQKEDVDNLVMEWSDIFGGSRNQMNEYEVLEGLRPPPKLRELQILFYGGTIFPSWVGEPSFDQLTKLTLLGCKRCTDLPAVGHLLSLKELSVKDMDGVKIFSFELPDSFHGTAFPSLEVLEFRDMQSWKRWSTRLGANSDGTSRSFPCLREVTIRDCPKLVEVSIDLIPSLYGLSIRGCSEVVFKSMVGASKSIGILDLWNIKGLRKINGEVLQLLGSLLRLNILDCENLVSVREKVESLESFIIPNTVEGLYFRNCYSLTSLTFSENQQLTLPLESLSIVDC